MDIASGTLFSSLANDTRLRSLMLLLRESGLVVDRREGLWVHYRIHPDLPEWVRRVLQDTFAGVADRSPFEGDAQALAQMPDRPGAPRCA